MEVLLFVYGTLMAGEPAHQRLEGARPLEAVRTAPGYALHHLGRYPAIAPGEGTVAGELYAVTPALLEKLDRYESVPDLYQRSDVLLADGRTALAYVMRPAQVLAHPAIPDGDWRAGKRVTR